jgi:hypothetical protein
MVEGRGECLSKLTQISISVNFCVMASKTMLFSLCSVASSTCVSGHQECLNTQEVFPTPRSGSYPLRINEKQKGLRQIFKTEPQ